MIITTISKLPKMGVAFFFFNIVEAFLRMILSALHGMLKNAKVNCKAQHTLQAILRVLLFFLREPWAPVRGTCNPFQKCTSLFNRELHLRSDIIPASLCCLFLGSVRIQGQNDFLSFFDNQVQMLLVAVACFLLDTETFTSTSF